jgi:hypothetical protein
MESQTGLLVPSYDPDREPGGPAWPRPAPQWRDTILQPPKPVMSRPKTHQREREPSLEPQA